MKCPGCGGNNFAWAQRCDHCGEVLTSTAGDGELVELIDGVDRLSKTLF